MDSHFNYTHWTKSSLPILADDWIGDQKLVEFIDLPGGIDLPEDLEFSMETMTKITLKDTKKNKKNKNNADDANTGAGNRVGSGGNGGNDNDPVVKPHLVEI